MPGKIPFFKTGAQALPKYQTEAERERAEFYSSPRWRRNRAAFLKKHQFCLMCLQDGYYTFAKVADHIVERLLTPKETWYDWDNLQPLCGSHHSKKHKGRKESNG